MPFRLNLPLFRVALYVLLVGPLLSHVTLPRAEIMMKGLFSLILFCLSAARLHETSSFPGHGGAFGRSRFLAHFLSHDFVSCRSNRC